METYDNLLSDLNDAQREAVLYNEGSSLIIAGAGSGKTRVLTYKIAYLLQQGYSPYQLMALTFTNKAAREMKERIANLLPSLRIGELWMGTFHSVFLRILRENAPYLGFPTYFTIYDETDAKELIKAIYKEMNLDEKVCKINSVRHYISEAKNNLLTPSQYLESPNSSAHSHAQEYPLIGKIYATYFERCYQARAMDFDDILLYTYLLFKQNPDILERYRERFRFLLVDEYQDTNLAQHTLIEMLAGKEGKVCAVGDDAQSIYSFRGANIDNILNFRTTFSGCKLFKLEQNYRSTKYIVDAANSLIKHNKMQIPKNVYSTKGEGEKLRVMQFLSDFEESTWVANMINELRLRSHNSLNEYAILYRTNAQSRAFEDAMRKKGLPYRIYGGIGFYQRKEIKDILSYLRLIINPKDEEAFCRIINVPARGIGQTTLTKLRITASLEGVSPWEVLQKEGMYGAEISQGIQKKLLGFRSLMENLMEENLNNDLPTLLLEVLNRSGLKQELYAENSPDSIERQQNVEEFVRSVGEYAQSRLEEEGREISLSEFLSEISLATDQDRNEEDENKERVTLMTVHAAKGLEFENIFVVGMQDGLFPFYRSYDSLREMEEERRLFYVAITRAKERCYLSSSRRSFRSPEGRPSRFLSDLNPRCIEGRENSFERSNTQHLTSANPYFENWNIRWETTSPNRKEEDSHSNVPDKTPHSPVNTNGLRVGSVIRHERFGVGKVLEIRDSGNDTKIVVQFKEVGVKTLLLKFVHYTLLEE